MWIDKFASFQGDNNNASSSQEPSSKRQIFTSWTNPSRASIKLQSISLLQEMKARGKTVIVVHHDLNTVPQYFDWVTMVNKQTIAYGPVADTFTDEAIERTYGKGRIV